MKTICNIKEFTVRYFPISCFISLLDFVVIKLFRTSAFNTLTLHCMLHTTTSGIMMSSLCFPICAPRWQCCEYAMFGDVLYPYGPAQSVWYPAVVLLQLPTDCHSGNRNIQDLSWLTVRAGWESDMHLYMFIFCHKAVI